MGLVTPKSILGRYMSPKERVDHEWDNKGNYVETGKHMEEVSYNCFANDHKLMEKYWNDSCVICHATTSSFAGMLILKGDKKHFSFFFINEKVNELGGFVARTFKRLDVDTAFSYFEKLKDEEKTICDEDAYMILKKTLLIDALEEKR